MILERSKNTRRNIIWGVFNKIIHILLPFFIRTIIIKEIGVEYLGLNSLFSSILLVLSITELGFDTSVVIVMYKGVATDDYKLLGALLAFMRKVYRYVGSFILFAGLSLIPFLPSLINNYEQLPDSINIYHIYIIFLLNSSISYFFGGYRTCLLCAYQRIDVVNNISAIVTIVFFALQIVILFSFKNYYLYIYTFILSSIANNALILLISRKFFPNIYPHGHLEKSEIDKIKKLVIGVFIAKLGNMLTISIDNIIVSAYLGVTILAYYSNYYIIASSLVSFFAIIYISMRGAMGNSVLHDSKYKNYRVMTILNMIYSWLVGWCSFALIFLIQPFIMLWIGQKGILPNYIAVLLGIYIYQEEFFGIIGSYKESSGIVWEDRYRPLCSGLFNIILKLLLVNIFVGYGENYVLASILISTILSYALVNNPWMIIILFEKYYKFGLKEVYKKSYGYFSVIVLCVLLSYPLFNAIPNLTGIYGFACLFLKFVLCLFIPNILMYLVYFRTQDYKDAKCFLITRVPFLRSIKNTQHLGFSCKA